jgi:hypothetical protein
MADKNSKSSDSVNGKFSHTEKGQRIFISVPTAQNSRINKGQGEDIYLNKKSGEPVKKK